MNTMKVMRFNDSSAEPGLIAGTASVPRPGPGELLVRVHAVGVTPTELLWYPTTHTKDGGKILKAAGRMVTIAADSEGTHDERTEAAFFIVEPNQQELSEIARLLDRGDLKVCVDGVVPLTQASGAYFGAAGRQPRAGQGSHHLD